MSNPSYSFAQEGAAALPSVDWEAKKRQSINFAKHLFGRSFSVGASEAPTLKRMSTNIMFCSNYLTENRRGKLMGSLCRVRLCPTCEWRKSLKRMSRIFQLCEMPEFLKYRAIFVTLTVKNVGSNELPSSISHLSKSFSNLMKSFEPAGGYMRTIEVTQGAGFITNRQTGNGVSVECHPHIHAIVLVRQSYFKKRYWSKSRWISEWRDAAGLDYDPSVYVRACGGSRGNDPARDLREVTKSLAYSVKPGVDENAASLFFLDRCVFALRNRRLMTCGGELRKMWSRTDDGSPEEGDKDIILDPARTNFRYNPVTGRYHFFSPPKKIAPEDIAA